MTDKTFTYAEITASAEAQIKAFMVNARKSGEVCQFHATAAWGVLWGWDRLTNGHQNPDDVVRLEALTETSEID